MEILIAFDTTTSAICAEKALLDAGIPVKVMNIPSSIKAGCGISLRLAPPDFARAARLLQDKNLASCGYYERMVENGKSQYTPYKGDMT